jgi:hypothetical protein
MSKRQRNFVESHPRAAVLRVIRNTTAKIFVRNASPRRRTLALRHGCWQRSELSRVLPSNRYVSVHSPRCSLLQIAPFGSTAPATTSLEATNVRSVLHPAEDGVGNESATNDSDFAE